MFFSMAVHTENNTLLDLSLDSISGVPKRDHLSDSDLFFVFIHMVKVETCRVLLCTPVAATTRSLKFVCPRSMCVLALE